MITPEKIEQLREALKYASYLAFEGHVPAEETRKEWDRIINETKPA